LNARLALGSDPDTVYAIGEFDGSVHLEAWHAETGVRVSSWAVARGARLVPSEVRRGEHDDEVLFAVRGMARTEVIAVDLATGSTRGCLVLPRETTWVPSIARDGAVATGCREADEWFVATLRHVERLVPCVVAVSHDGSLAAVSTDDPVGARIIEVHTGVTRAWLVRPGGAKVAALTFSNSDATLWATGEEEITCWDVASGVTLGHWRGLSMGRPVALSPDGLRALFERPIALAVGSERAIDHRGVAWDGVDARVSPDGRRLAASAGVLSWIDLARDARVELTGTGHTAAVCAIAVSGDGARVASCAGDATIRVWEAATGACEWVLEGDPSGYDALAFAPDGRTLYATSTSPRRLTAWSLHEGTETTPRAVAFPGDGLQVSPDGQTVAARYTTKRQFADAGVFNLGAFAPTAPWLPRALMQQGINPRAGVTLGFSREGAMLEAFGHDPMPVGATFDLATGACTETTLDPFSSALPRVVAFSPNGRWLVAVREDGGAVEVVFHAVANAYNAVGRCRFRARLGDVPVAVSEHLAAVAEADGFVTVADRRNGRTWCVAELRSQATTLALSPDEKTLYVGTHNGQVRVYSV
jgi:WD40 repeat protein